jgi:crossover junction endodeoxyribonuclease RuvC
VLGIDASLRSTGVGVVEARGSRLAAVEYGTIRTSPSTALSGCLRKLQEGILAAIDRSAPSAAALEGAFFCKNVKTAMILGQARGVVLAACAERQVPIFEYAPRRVKQAVVGFGAASKEQVGKMVARLLNLHEEPAEDAADALAIAICHLHNRSGSGLLAAREI